MNWNRTQKGTRMTSDTGSLFYRILRALLVQSGKMRKEGDMISVYKYIKPQNSLEREQLFKLKDNVGTRTNGYKLAENKLVWK